MKSLLSHQKFIMGDSLFPPLLVLGMTTDEVLEQVGLSKNETKVYLALLEIGAATAGEIASQAKIHRTNVYDAMERLLEKGLVTFTTDDHDSRVFDATSPENLISL